MGRINTGDGLFSLWVVNWVARTLVADPTNLYDANIFYPDKNTLAFSEANIAPGAVAVPFYWLTKNPYVTHNVVVLIAFVLAFVGAYCLVVIPERLDRRARGPPVSRSRSAPSSSRAPRTSSC